MSDAIVSACNYCPDTSVAKANSEFEVAGCLRLTRAIRFGGLPPVMWFIRRHMRKHRSGGLSVPQFRALTLIDRAPKATLSLVAEYMGTSQPSASRLITGLVSKGFVTRKECSKDRRQVSLALTPRGRNAFESAQHATQQRIAEKIHSLSDADRSSIGAAMQMLQDVFVKNDCEPGETAKQALRNVVKAKIAAGG